MLSAARLPQIRAEACISLQVSWEWSLDCPNYIRRTKSSIKKRIIVRRSVPSMFGEQTFAQLTTGLRLVSRGTSALPSLQKLWSVDTVLRLCPHNYKTLKWLSSLPTLKPVLNWANVCSPNILRTLQRTMICFLIELLVHRIWFGQSKLYFVLKWLVMRCKLLPEFAADAQQTAWSKM